MKQILYTFIYLLIGSFSFSQECEECVCEEPENVWFKVSYNENHRYGEILTIDMSAGAALYDESYIYLLVLEKNTGEELVIMFPIGYWSKKPVEKLKESNIFSNNIEITKRFRSTSLIKFVHINYKIRYYFFL